LGVKLKFRHLLIAVLPVAIGASLPAHPNEIASSSYASFTWPEVLKLKAARDYFTLRERVKSSTDTSSAPAMFARILVNHAFNHPAASNAGIESLISTTKLPDSVVSDLRRMEADNHRRLFQYSAGLASLETLLSNNTGLDSTELDDVRNAEKILRALSGIAPQTVQFSGPTTVHFDHGNIPVLVNDSARSFGFDTGANISVIMRSEAVATGVRILPAGIDVATSTDKRVTADLGVADRITIGNVHFRNVVFLVFDDSLLTFPGGFRIPGLVGFPMIEQMGEIELDKGGVLKIPVTPSFRKPNNLALENLTPLTQMRWKGSKLLCRLDTGAGHTQMYEHFYSRFRTAIDASSTNATRHVGGAGGIRETPVRVLKNPTFMVGDTSIVMDSVDVLPKSIVSDPADNYLDCNIGHDILDSFSGFILNFRDMAFLLR
ncbi:MAG: retropepsin-like aspartic protease, partial [Thermoanaerobaculia bacterium]